MPPLIDVRVDVRTQKFAIWRAYEYLGNFFGFKKGKIFSAYNSANKVHRRYKDLMLAGHHPLNAMSALKDNGDLSSPQHTGQLTFALLGYPYNLYDPFISIQLIDKLQKMGINILTPENVSAKILQIQPPVLQKSLFWTFSEQVMQAAKYFLKSGKIDGVIHLTAFGCGPDSLLNNFIEREATKYPHIPLMTLTIDEHGGEAGITTRLEAFIDMVQRKKRGVRNA